MTQEANFGRLWTYTGIDQDGQEVDRVRLDDAKLALAHFREHLSAEHQEITVTQVSDGGAETPVGILRRSVADD